MRAAFVLCVVAASLAGCASRPVEEVLAERALALRQDGDAALKAGNHDDAIEYFTRSLELNPEAPETWARRGIAFAKHPAEPGAGSRRQRDFLRMAEGDFTQAVRLNPAHYTGFFHRAMVYMKMKRYIDAARDLLECARLNPRDPEPEFILGEIYLNRLEDQQVLAMDHYDKYVAAGGDDPRIVKMVREWRELKKSLAGAPPGAAPKVPTEEDETAARQLHARFLSVLPKGEEHRPEALKLLEELTAKYAHTKYVKENEKALQTFLNALRPKEPEKK
jgi:tetratricopeptide (TPR) repeat protein